MTSKFRTEFDMSSANDENTAGVIDGNRNVTFDLNDARTRQFDEGANSADHDVPTNTLPPAYSRSHRDSSVSMGGATCECGKPLPTSNVEPASPPSHTGGNSPTQPRTLSTGKSIPAKLRRFSAEKDDRRRMSLGPAMDRWRLEEEERVRAAKRNGEAVPPLSPPVSPRPQSKWPTEFPSPRSPFDRTFEQNEGRRPSLGLAMEQWRLEELEGFESDDQVAPALLAPPTISR